MARLDFQVLLFYAKLCHSDPKSFLGKMHKYRSSRPNNPPIGFYTTVKYTLAKYKLRRLWNNIPRYDHSKLKSFLKQPIWDFHLNCDADAANITKTPFAIAYLNKLRHTKKPFKAQYLISSLDSNTFPRCSLSNVLRFWTTPSRLRTCTCKVETTHLIHHLIFECSLTRDPMSCYIPTLSRRLANLLKPNTMTNFFLTIVKSAESLENFNLLIGQFDIPRY